MQLTLLRDAGKHRKGAHLRVWIDGQLAADQVDQQRAEQWIRDGIAEPRRFARAPIGDEADDMASDPDPGDVDSEGPKRRRTARKRGK